MVVEATREEWGHGGGTRISPWFLRDAELPFRRKPPSLSEHALQALWHARAWGALSLVTRDGRLLRVLHAGHWSHDGGPDFRQAILEIDGRTVVGDVEAHLRASDWDLHGHGADAAYARVALHVLLEDDRPSPWTRGPSGAAIPKLVVGEWAVRLASAAPKGLPEAVWLGPGGCRGRADAAHLAETLRVKGAERVSRRAAEIASRAASAGAEQAAWEVLAEGLGYGRNAVPFLALARRVPVAELRAVIQPLSAEEREEHARAILLGAAGLLSMQAGLREIWYEHAEDWGRESMPPGSWRMDTMPGNSPPRRMAALAALVAREGDFLPAWTEAVTRGEAHLLRMLSVPGLGTDRARVLAVNAIAPTVLACRPELGGAVRAFLDSLPAPAANRLTRLARYRILGDSKSTLGGTALEEQGLLQLSVEGCQWGRDGCERCVLGARDRGSGVRELIPDP